MKFFFIVYLLVFINLAFASAQNPENVFDQNVTEHIINTSSNYNKGVTKNCTH